MVDAAADGTNIGAVADEPSRHAVPMAPGAFDPETAHIRRYEVALREGTDFECTDKESAAYVPDDAVELVLPGYRNEFARERAVQLYVEGDKSLREIAACVGVPLRTVAKWAEAGNWTQFQESLVSVVKRDESARLTMTRIAHREKAMRGQLALGDKLSQRAEDILDEQGDDLSPSKLKLVAEAAKLSSDMTNRALGIGESGEIDRGRAVKEDAPSGPQTISLVNIFKNGAPEVETRSAVTVEVPTD